MKNLGVDYLDLYLIHHPFNDYYGAWRALEDLYKEGQIRAIGVSNFFDDRYFDLVTHNSVVPAINQLETHPFNQNIDTQRLLEKYGTKLQAWSPLGHGDESILSNDALTHIAASHGKTVPQVFLRWLIQRGVTVVTKTTHTERLYENTDIFSFELSEEEMTMIASLDKKQASAGFDHRDPKMLELLLTLD